jgi:hypothetical protein
MTEQPNRKMEILNRVLGLLPPQPRADAVQDCSDDVPDRKT